MNRSKSCNYPEGCISGASETNNFQVKLAKIQAEIAKREAAVEELQAEAKAIESQRASQRAELTSAIESSRQWMKCAKAVDLKMLAEQADHNKTVDKLIAANATINQLTDALYTIHVTANCIAKAGPLATPDLWSAWIKFDRISVMATNAIAASQKTNEHTK